MTRQRLAIFWLASTKARATSCPDGSMSLGESAREQVPGLTAVNVL